MDALIEFLRARLDEDEAAASGATDGPWSVDDPSHAEAIYSPDRTVVVGGGRWGGEASVFETTEDAVHIARHDPARVLRQTAALRLVVTEYEKEARVIAAGHNTGWTEGGQAARATAIRAFAAAWSDHPDYRQEWAL